jgi:hypothetical protein
MQFVGHDQGAPCCWSAKDYAELDWHLHNESRCVSVPCGIIRIAALCDLCRYRHNGHATGAQHRLKRQFGRRFGDKAYAFEELVACLGQSFISAELGLPASLHDSHASYIASWIDVLERDKTAIIHAAAKAEQAVTWLRCCSAVVVDGGRLVIEASPRPRYSLAELLAVSDYPEALPPEDREWLDAPTVGKELL